MDVATAPSAIKPPETETYVYNNSTMSAETEKLVHSMETAWTDTSGHFTVVSRLCIVQSCHTQMYTVKVGQRYPPQSDIRQETRAQDMWHKFSFELQSVYRTHWLNILSKANEYKPDVFALSYMNLTTVCLAQTHIKST